MHLVKGKVSSVTKKVSSSVKTKLDKVKALGGTKLDSLKTNVSSRISKAKNGEGIVCKAKSFVTNKPSCFTSDTLIDTEYGLRKIGELKVGDKVYSVDEDNVEEEASLKEIKQVIVSKTDTLIKLTIDGEEIKTTKTHPFYVEGKGFIDAEYIVVGDKVRTSNGEIEEVEDKEVEELDESIDVYNLEVEDSRTYYVGSEEILVHNMCAKVTKGVAEARLIPGKEGIVTGGNSTKLGQNLFKDMGLPRTTSRTPYQAMHIIPKELRNHPVLKKIGMNLDDASNGLFLRNRKSGGVSPMSRHEGFHKIYNRFMEGKLDNLDINLSTSELEKQVYDLQQKGKYLMEQGLPMYNKEGASIDLWERWFNK